MWLIANNSLLSSSFSFPLCDGEFIAIPSQLQLLGLDTSYLPLSDTLRKRPCHSGSAAGANTADCDKLFHRLISNRRLAGGGCRNALRCIYSGEYKIHYVTLTPTEMFFCWEASHNFDLNGHYEAKERKREKKIKNSNDVFRIRFIESTTFPTIQ